MASSGFRVFKSCRTILAAAEGSAAPAATEAKTPKLTAVTMPRKVSPELSKFFGAPEVSRAASMMKIWEYIKLINLKNPSKNREINSYAKLKTIFYGKNTVRML